jgi:hypothetical protein
LFKQFKLIITKANFRNIDPASSDEKLNMGDVIAYYLRFKMLEGRCPDMYTTT